MTKYFAKKVQNLKMLTWTEWRSVWSKCHPENIRWAQVLFRNCFGRVLCSSFDLINFIPKISFILRPTVTPGRTVLQTEVNVTFLKKCNDEQNNASWYQTFVIVQTDWFKQEIYVFLDCVFEMTRNLLQADFKQQFLKRIPEYENMHEMHLNVSVHLKSYHLYHFHLFTFKIHRSTASS